MEINMITMKYQQHKHISESDYNLDYRSYRIQNTEIIKYLKNRQS